jgi:hypothetical protein
MTRQCFFRITFLGQPPVQWDDWFDTPVGLENQQKNFIFSGQVSDLAEFMGVLSRFQLLNLDPISMRYSIDPIETSPEKPAQDAS